jgi:hypothetical protein
MSPVHPMNVQSNAHPAPLMELLESLDALSKEAEARGFPQVAGEIQTIAWDLSKASVELAGAHASLKAFADCAIVGRQPTRAELFDRAAEACQRALAPAAEVA